MRSTIPTTDLTRLKAKLEQVSSRFRVDHDGERFIICKAGDPIPVFGGRYQWWTPSSWGISGGGPITSASSPTTTTTCSRYEDGGCGVDAGTHLLLRDSGSVKERKGRDFHS